MITCTKKVGGKGEVLIPRALREESGIKPKQKVEIISSKSGIFIVPLIKDIKELRGLFKEEGYKHKKDVDDLLFRVMAGI